MKVHLRQRKQTKKGMISLYLEIYKGSITTPEGKVKPVREYEYLNLYLKDKPSTVADRQNNKERLQLAESIKSKRELEIKNGIYGFTSTKKQSINFIEYFRQQTEKRLQSLGNYGNWDSTLKHLVNYKGNKVTFKDVDENFCEGFKDYLTCKAETKSKNRLSSASVSSYFNKFRACLKKAVKDKIISFNPCDGVSIPKADESKREHLTIDELRAIVITECRYEVLKRAFIFSCLTGLRWSDIHKLQWSEVQNINGSYRIVFHQQKTKGLQYLDISKQASNYLGIPGMPQDRVFTNLRYSSHVNVELTKWMLKAGITKDITFHCARHTFAVLQLTMGTDIYTLSKLLGHSEIRTTEIYANIIDEKRKEAMNKIPDITI